MVLYFYFDAIVSSSILNINISCDWTHHRYWNSPASKSHSTKSRKKNNSVHRHHIVERRRGISASRFHSRRNGSSFTKRPYCELRSKAPGRPAVTTGCTARRRFLRNTNSGVDATRIFNEKGDVIWLSASVVCQHWWHTSCESRTWYINITTIEKITWE